MSIDQEQLAPATSGGEMFRRPPWLTYAFTAVTLASVAGQEFLTYLQPAAADWLLWIGVAGIAIAVVWLITCAFIRKPRSAPVLLATLLIFFVPYLFERENAPWLTSLGFRLQASPLAQYLKECRLVEFNEAGVAQAMGFCERREFGYSLNTQFDSVFYDSTGGIQKPERGTPEWTQAWHDLEAADVGLIRTCGVAIRLVDHFYRVCTAYGM